MERSHQFVVLMLQKVTMVDIPRILNKLIFRSIEVGVASSAINKIFSPGPSDPQNQDSPVIEKSHFFPPPVFRSHIFVADRPTYVLVIALAAGILVVLDSFRLIGELLIDIKANNRGIVLIGGVLRKGIIEESLNLFIKDINRHRFDAKISIVVRRSEET